MVKYGYIRVSTRSQASNYSFEAQKNALILAGILEENIHQETISGEAQSRLVFDSLLSVLRRGDELFVTSIDRFSRNFAQGAVILGDLRSRGVRFHALDLGPSDDSDTTVLLQNVLLSFAAYETARRRLRQRAGIDLAKENPDKYKGKPSKLTPSFLAKVSGYLARQNTPTEIARMLNCTRPTVYKAIKAINEKSGS